MYEAFESASGAKGPQIAYFDDAWGNVEAAAARGWHATRIDPLGDPAMQMRGHLRDLGFLP
jgi:FMN phosphatase YigB (HAD superfamily)